MMYFEDIKEKLETKRKERIKREDNSQKLAKKAARRAGWRRTNDIESLKYNADFVHSDSFSYANGDWLSLCRVFNINFKSN